MRHLSFIAIALVIFWSQISLAGLFSFMTCGGGGEDETLCRFCIASSAQGSNRVCSKPYNKDFKYKDNSTGAIGKSLGFKSISEDLADDFANKLIEIKEFPKENFDVKEFYEKYAEYSCERGEKEVKTITLQLEDFKKEDSSKKEWNDRQIKYLKWKRKKIKESMIEKKCPKL